jgi:hypothetical protein
MRYVLGTDTEMLVFTEHGIEQVPAGRAHAVDPQSELNRSFGALAYAVCGRAVRAWPEERFDPDGVGVHEACKARSRATDGRHPLPDQRP